MASSLGGLPPLKHDYSRDFPDDLSNKRPRTFNLDEYSTVNGQRQKHEAKYLLIDNAKDDTHFNKVSPFVVQKGLDMITTGLKNVKKLRTGQLLVETKYSGQISKLLNAKMLAGIIPISVKLHPHLNSTKGIVYAAQLIDESEQNLLTELSDQKVVEVKRIRRLALPSESLLKDAEGYVKTPLLIITFDTTTLPRKFKAGYLNLNVEVYVPNPMRCKNCQMFGHTKKWCKSNAACAKCSLEFNDDHPEDIMCTYNANCANCHGSHEAFRKSCKRFKEEYAISRIKTTERISYHEAKQRFAQTNVTGSTTSVAEVIKISNRFAELAATPTTTTTTSRTIKATVPSTLPKITPKAQITQTIEKTSSSGLGNSDVQILSPPRHHKQQSPLSPKKPVSEIYEQKQDDPKKVKTVSSTPKPLSEEEREQLKLKLKQLQQNKDSNQTTQQHDESSTSFAFPPTHLDQKYTSDENESSTSCTSKNSKKSTSNKKTRNKKSKVKPLSMDIE